MKDGIDITVDAEKSPKIYIVDVTNRDGVQTSRLGLAKLQKTIINLLLDEMGVWQSEFGFPATLHEVNYLRANLDLVELGAINRMRLSGWLRAMASDVETAREMMLRLKFINLSISTSDQMIIGKWQGKLSFDDVVKKMCAALDRARELGFESIGINSEDASRTSDERLIQFALAAKEHGATRVRYCDTLGYNDPFTLYDRIRLMAEETGIDIELHCHNDLGMGVASSVAGAKGALDGGVNAFINTTINGMGERAGNADLVSTILAILKSSLFAGQDVLDDSLNLMMSWKIAKYAAYAFGVPIPVNHPGVGDNAFAHESGIHADGALKDRRNYELYDYEELGRGEPDVIETGRSITAGEYSGIKGFRNVYEKLEVEFQSEEEARNILELVRYANVSTQKPLVEDELLFIARYPELARKILTLEPAPIKSPVKTSQT
ncbi:MAG: homocitrate synthase [Actinobacteria bacterium RBG_19FT_COMBO_54_7]|uniref:Homocitrate synthase n=1 Tax=Candidatus Solincola sediminis TaxID=1797199 RepID=A0A1F2WS86_9ACTN|nr:MAG: homocitrate synthase [Candidatus Solincola sediminis]OFW61634.1 MAG: homocitrate synthase [Candidatus Solincola sediminis]OFW70838.1 MAG: homocitrate synthase [Actinobacteria bacterium RBG_19FT_COMBO_54_7]